MYSILTKRGSTGRIATYATADVAEAHRGWVAGSFVKTDTGEPLTSAFEIKLTEFRAGDGKDEWSSDPDGQTWELVLEGHMRNVFLVDGEEVTVDLFPGLASLWDNNVPHRWTAMQDTKSICVRVR